MSTLTLSRSRYSEPTFAQALPGELYRAPDGTLKRKPMLTTIPAATTPAQPVARPQTPRPGLPKADSLRAPQRGQKPARQTPAKSGGKVPAYLVALGHTLRAQYPVFADNKPLKVGILADLVSTGISATTARAFLKNYTVRAEYVRAVATGNNRFNLDGTVAGEISEKHRDFAIEQLKESSK